MLCIPIIGPRLPDIERQLSLATAVADIVELRIDLFQEVTQSDLQWLKERFIIPMLFSLRSVEQGGAYKGTLSDRCHYLHKLAGLHPELLDVQSDMPHDEIIKLKHRSPKVRLLASYHNHSETPSDLTAELERLQLMQVDQYKLATLARTTQDALRMIRVTQQFNHNGGRLTGICMGPEGTATRIFASQIGSPLIFCCLEEALASASGQIPWRDLLETYRLRERTPNAKKLALIGNPVDKSPGHIANNAIFHHLNLDAIYAKIRVEPSHLTPLVELLRTTQWHGLAVTIPLKEQIIPLLDLIDPSAAAMGAVNTIVVREGQWIGYNTDGEGALDAIEAATGPVLGKQVLVVGAGGAAKGIAWAARQRGAIVSIVNRTDSRAEQTAKKLSCQYIPWKQLEHAVKKSNLILQTTPVGIANDETLINPAWIPSDAIVFDAIINPRETRLLKDAKSRGCQIVTGVEMFIGQALRQIGIWFGQDKVTPELAEQYKRVLK